MECNEARPLLHASVDGELGPADLLRLEAHLAACPACTGEIAQLRTLQHVVREGAPYHRVDPAFRTRLLASLPAATNPGPAVPARRRPSLWPWQVWSGPGRVGLALAMVALIALGMGQFAQYQSGRETVARELVSSHVRALLSGRALDVVSLDQHTVKPWFNGRLDYAPVVRDLSAQGFPLVGGRLDYVDGRRVAVLVYRRNQHPIDVFVFPEEPGGLPPALTGARQGYQFESWDADAMRFVAITDASADDLKAFRRAWLAGATAPRAQP